jgi:hypothetical protein
MVTLLSKMIYADFLAGANLAIRDPEKLLSSDEILQVPAWRSTAGIPQRLE